MKQLQAPPNWAEILKKHESSFALFQDAKYRTLVQRANDRYLHWHEFRFRPVPEGIDRELAWAFVKISRLAQSRPTPLESKEGPPFTYWLPDSIQRELHTIDQNATGQILLDEPISPAADRDRYVFNSLMEEAIASSLLEGAATTRKKAKEMLREGRKPTNHAERMIINNFETMRSVKERSQEQLSQALLLDLQASITAGTLEDPEASGRFRRADELVQVVDMTDGTVLHTPPPAGALPDRIQALCDYATTTSDTEFIHPVVKATILHFWLAYEHPFVDGNGRTARALFYWYLLKEKYWLIEYLPISRIILKAPSKYKMAFLFAETDDYDLTYFIKFHLRAFRLSVNDLRVYMKRKQEEVRDASRLVRRVKGLNHRQQELIRHALSHPDYGYTIARHQRTHGVVYQTARTDLLGLVNRKLLRSDRLGHSLVFFPAPNLQKILKLDLQR